MVVGRCDRLSRAPLRRAHPSGRAGYGMCWYAFPAAWRVPHIPLPGTPREARSCLVLPFSREPAARPNSVVADLPINHSSDDAVRATLGRQGRPRRLVLREGKGARHRTADLLELRSRKDAASRNGGVTSHRSDNSPVGEASLGRIPMVLLPTNPRRVGPGGSIIPLSIRSKHTFKHLPGTLVRPRSRHALLAIPLMVSYIVCEPLTARMRRRW
jgi:hypothetical protein